MTAILGKAGVPILSWNGPSSASQSMLSVVMGTWLNRVVLIPDIYFLGSNGYSDLKWTEWVQRNATQDDAKVWDHMKNRVVFQGSSAGNPPGSVADLDINDRLALVLKARESGCIDAGVTNTVQLSEVVAQAVTEQGLLKGAMNQHDMMQSKGLLDIDGNTNSWGIWKLLGSSGEP